MTQSTTNIGAKTSRDIAPKLNKDIALSPQSKTAKKGQLFGQIKKSLQGVSRKYACFYISNLYSQKSQLIDEAVQTLKNPPKVEPLLALPAPIDASSPTNFLPLINNILKSGTQFLKI